jgi:hypothetical protein
LAPNEAYEGFLASEIHGVWGPPIKLLADADAEGNLYGINQVSCSSNGLCVAVGDDSAGAYTLDVSDGVWSAPVMITAVGGADPGTAAGTPLVSCPSGGNCSWTSNNFVSCPSSGNCTVAGYYTVSANQTTGVFTLDERGGVWGAPQELAALAQPNTEPLSSRPSPPSSPRSRVVVWATASWAASTTSLAPPSRTPKSHSPPAKLARLVQRDRGAWHRGAQRARRRQCDERGAHHGRYLHDDRRLRHG